MLTSLRRGQFTVELSSDQSRTGVPENFGQKYRGVPGQKLSSCRARGLMRGHNGWWGKCAAVEGGPAPSGNLEEVA